VGDHPGGQLARVLTKETAGRGRSSLGRFVVEDAGDTLHTQRQALDSGYDFDVTSDYLHGAQPTRFLAQGRDFAATLDSANGGYGKNEGDNEITGIHISNGDPSINGILGTKIPRFGFDSKWRFFYTGQHGENRTWEVTLAPKLSGR
jgi:hypothetical protein